MLEVWFSVIPSKGDYAPFMKKYPNLYLVCPDAAILNLYKSFETTLSLIFSYSPRSEDFMKVSSYNLDLGNIKCESKVKRMHQIQEYFMDIFVTTNCMKRMTEWINKSNKNKSPDLKIILSILSSIAMTYTRVEVKHEEYNEFNETIKEYLYGKSSGLIDKIRNLPASQLKDIKEDDFTKVLNNYYECSGQTIDKESYIARIQFSILLIFLQ